MYYIFLSLGFQYIIISYKCYFFVVLQSYNMVKVISFLKGNINEISKHRCMYTDYGTLNKNGKKYIYV